MDKRKETEEFGAFTGIIIIVLLLLFGAFYFVKDRIEKQKEFRAMIEQNSLDMSDDIVNIEYSATSMNFDGLGEGIDEL
jgi:preprotein translocase subunit YajC